MHITDEQLDEVPSGGAVDYDQAHHRDDTNHSLVVPRADGRWPQLTTFTLLSDVDEWSGPTKIIPRSLGRSHPRVPNRLPMGELVDDEVPPGHEYWNDQTLADVGLRYRGMDMSPYSKAR